MKVQLKSTDGTENLYPVTAANSVIFPDGNNLEAKFPELVGKSAYQSWLDAGHTGTENDFLASLKGDQGEKGSTGLTGPQGPQGPQGEKGDQGNSGYTGAAGELEVVNNLTEGGETAALSAEQGKTLKGLIDSSDAQWSALSDKEQMSLNGKVLRELSLDITDDVYDSMSIYGIKQISVLTAVFDDKSTEIITDYVLTGVIVAGSQEFTATYQGLKARLTKTVLHREATLSSITASATVESISMYSELNQLRQYLLVKKVFSDDSEEYTEDYSLSGELVSGESTITVTYTPNTQLTTTVTITGYSDGSYTPDGLAIMLDFSEYEDNYSGDLINSVDGSVIGTGNGTLETALTKTPYGGIHNHTFVMSKWMEGTAQKGLYLSFPSATPAFPMTVEFYGRLRAPYSNGGTLPTVGAFSSTRYPIIRFYAGSTNNLYNIRTSSDREIQVLGHTNVPNLITSNLGLQYYDSTNTTVKDLVHVVVCLNTKFGQLYVNGVKVIDSTNNTYANAGGKDLYILPEYKYLAGDICMVRAYNRVLNGKEIQRNYLNCVALFGTTITEDE